jgi:hypothetical protein
MEGLQRWRRKYYGETMEQRQRLEEMVNGENSNML